VGTKTSRFKDPHLSLWGQRCIGKFPVGVVGATPWVKSSKRSNGMNTNERCGNKGSGGNTDTSDGVSEDEYKKLDTLERLYHEEGLSQGEIAERFGITQQAVSYWFGKLGVETSTGDRSVSRWVDGGYSRLTDGEGMVYEHHLCAIADGADPHDVFADGTKVVHHQTCKLIDTPDTVEVIDRGSHSRLHISDVGYWFEWDDGIPRQRTGGQVSQLMDDEVRKEAFDIVEKA